jgi:glycosyltransferase involved in cell wall biosynthesis
MLEVTLQRLALFNRAPAEIVRPSRVGADRPTVTVVIPCYNYGRYLDDCTASALEQGDVDVDVIVVDDASTDDTAQVCARIASADSRVAVVRHPTNMGHIETYNDGLSRAQGEFVVLLSADDLLTPGALGRATALLRARPGVGFCYGTAVPFSGATPPRPRTRVRTWTIWPGSAWIVDRCRTGRNTIKSPEVVMRADVLKRIGPYRQDLPHTADFDLWLRAASISDVGLVSGADQAYYRRHSANMSNVLYEGMVDLRERRKTFELLVGRSPQKEADMLREASSRALAREALIHAAIARDERTVGADLVEQYIEFARTVWKDAPLLPEWRTLEAEQDAARDGVRHPTSLARRLVRQLKTDLRARRARMTGD